MYYNIQNCLFLYKNLEIIKKNVHRGNLLRKAVEKTGVNIDVIARKAGYKRGTYYLHRQKEDLSFEILAKYGRAIGHDFSDDFPGMSKLIVEEEGYAYKKEPATLEEALRERDEWREKYYALMEKYVKVVENG